MFDRLELLIGNNNLTKIKNTKVLVVGVGGVGGECVLSLIRSGIENIVIIDFDIVDITNINRQVVAYHSTIGKKKVDVLEVEYYSEQDSSGGYISRFTVLDYLLSDFYKTKGGNRILRAIHTDLLGGRI